MRGSASAPGKAILLGEHAVVYTKPALAIPLPQLRAVASFRPAEQPLTIQAADLPGRSWQWGAGDSSDPLGKMATLSLRHLGCDAPKGEITIRSAIPIASGLGSGAAVSAALGRAIAALCHVEIPNVELNALVYEVEKLHHGTPSGIDNRTVVFEQPIYFQRGQPIESIRPPRRLNFLLADTGVPALTRETVAAVRRLLREEPERTQSQLDQIASAVDSARAALEAADVFRLGAMMTANHGFLRDLGVSSPALDTLATAAIQAGALGAKLSGGGRGGHIIALVEADTTWSVRQALQTAGALRIHAASLGG
ncbi:MAG: mevalonate kinase [Chloroflexi bacterium]|nr:mevalonate kinase [Chloroflexota bacterium]MYC56719.1 mevalonate kinase [Chloroflexota bacterium]